MAKNPYGNSKCNTEWGRKSRKEEDRHGRKRAADRFAISEGLDEIER